MIPGEHHFDTKVDRGYPSQAIDSDLKSCNSQKVNPSRDLSCFNVKEKYEEPVSTFSLICFLSSPVKIKFICPYCLGKSMQ